MKLPISQLKDGENPFDFHSPKDGWLRTLVHQIESKGYRFSGDLNVTMKVIKIEPDYYIRGKMSFQVGQTCSRCAEEFLLPVEHQFDVALAHVSATKRPPAQPLSQESEELDVNFFEGNEIELPPILEEQFFLSLPYQALCKKQCRGICQLCGTNLNQKSCACTVDAEARPFSILRGYKL